VRLYLGAGEANFVDVDAGQIVSWDMVPDPLPAVTEKLQPIAAVRAELTPADLRQLLVRAGTEQNLSVDLLASVVRAESGGHARAVSRAGAQGLMQLMPKTAAGLGVEDSFEPGQNVHGGSTYLNSLLLKYHDNLALALAAYNAGPAAVDRWHGIPPYRETRAYVARVIHEFNRSYAAHRSPITGTARAADRASRRTTRGADAAAAERASTVPRAVKSDGARSAVGISPGTNGVRNGARDQSASRTTGPSTLVARAGAAGTDNE
jgi:hypothetical protein